MKSSLKIAAVLVFAGTLFLNVSFDSKGLFNLVAQAKAMTKNQQRYSLLCSDGLTVILLCGEGTATCSPIGTCP